MKRIKAHSWDILHGRFDASILSFNGSGVFMVRPFLDFAWIFVLRFWLSLLLRGLLYLA
jgi:hypothetical protein